MTALDTNVLIRYLVDGHPQQASARKLMVELTLARRGFIYREVSVELARIIDRTHVISRNRIATLFEEFATGYRTGGNDFAKQIIAAAEKRSSADSLYTLDRQDGYLQAPSHLPAERV